MSVDLTRTIRVCAMTAVASAAWLVAAASAGAQGPPQQCPVVVENTTLKSDCLGPMIVASDGVNVNLNRHEITCNGDRTRDGVLLVNRSRVHLENGHVHGCRIGVNVTGGSGNRFNNLHVDDHSQRGIQLNRSHSNEVVGSVVEESGFIGVLLIAANENKLSALDVTHNGTGVYLTTASSANRLRGLTIRTHTLDGLVLDFQSDDNRVQSTRVTGSARTALYLWGDRNEIEGNVFSEVSGTQPARPANGTGVYVLVPSSENRIRANIASDNARDGIEVLGSDNVVQANKARRNGQDGITAGSAPENPGPTGNTFVGNSALENEGFDLADYPPGLCTLNSWVENQGVKLYNGCETG